MSCISTGSATYRVDQKVTLLMTDKKLQLPSGSDFPGMFAHQILQCVVKCRPDRALREPPLRAKRDNEPLAHVKNKQRCWGPQHQFRLPFSSETVTLHSLRPDHLTYCCHINRAIQISCTKIANNYLFIGRWGEEGQRKGASWWMGALVKSCSRKQLTQEYLFTRQLHEMPRQQGLEPGPKDPSRHPFETNADNWPRRSTECCTDGAGQACHNKRYINMTHSNQINHFSSHDYLHLHAC